MKLSRPKESWIWKYLIPLLCLAILWFAITGVSSSLGLYGLKNSLTMNQQLATTK